MSDESPFTFTVTIKTDGTIMVGPIDDPKDFDMARESIISMMSNIGTTVVETDCLNPVEVDGITRRLAEVLLGGAR